MNSIFLRIYGGLLFALILVLLLSGIAVTVINSARLLDYRESVIGGTFRLVAEKVAQLPVSERQSWLDDWGSRLGIPFSLVNDNSVALTDDIRLALNQGRVHLGLTNEVQTQILTQVESGLLLQGWPTVISEQTAQGTIRLLREWLGAMPVEQRLAEIERLNEGVLSYSVALVPLITTRLHPLDKELLSNGGVITQLDSDTATVTAFTKLENTDQAVRYGPLPVFNAYPFKLIFTIGIFMLSSLSLAIYVLVRGMEKRLRKLERAATRFRKGDFEVRAHVVGGDSIGSLAVAFNAMAAHIQHLISVQKEMIRGVSHELRTPVARLRFALEMIADADSVKAREQQLEGMDKDIEELDTLVDEFLTYANLGQDAPTIQLQQQDVESIIKRVIDEHLRQQSRVTIEYVPANPAAAMPLVDIEARYMHRAIQNLIGNACRYANSKIQISFIAGQNVCRIHVDDDGPGIPENQWERVFTAFSRVDDSRTRKSGGYGLGLSIVQRIMFWHKGKAQVQHSPLGGARFSLIWPRKQQRRKISLLKAPKQT